jgi:hypothetical protein
MGDPMNSRTATLVEIDLHEDFDGFRTRRSPIGPATLREIDSLQRARKAFESVGCGLECRSAQRPPERTGEEAEVTIPGASGWRRVSRG